MTYPFLIRGPTRSARVKMVKLEAVSFRHAMLKAFALYPIKFINFKFAKNMDLISANAEAKKASMDGKQRFVISHKNQECSVEFNEPSHIGDVLHAVWLKGKKVKESIEAPTTKQPAKRMSEQIMEEAAIIEQAEKENKIINKTKPKQVMTKKAVKKVAPKKVAHKKVAGSESWGKQVSISIKDMRAGIKKGFAYRDPQGVIQSEKYLATRAKQDHVRDGMYVSKAA